MRIIASTRALFSNGNKFRVVTDPKDLSKLVFGQDGRCCLFRHRNGEQQLKWIARTATFFTSFNCVLAGIESAYPVFGIWNQVSFSLCAGIGLLGLAAFQTLSSRTIRCVYLHKNLETIDVQFFNAFWKNRIITFHISQFQDPTPSYLSFLRVDLTSIGKAWIKLQKNQYKNVKQYEQTLDSILLGKPLTNLNVPKKK